MSVNHLTKLIQIAILSAMAYILTLIAIPIIPIVPYLKLDLSDLPILVGTVSLGIDAGISIAALTMVLHLLMTGFALPTVFGDAVLFISSITILLTVGLLINRYHQHPFRWQKLLLISLLTINLTVIMAVINLVAIPLYMKIMGITIQLPVTKIVELGVIPFNLIKGMVIGSLFLFLNRYLRGVKYFRIN